MSYLLSFDGDLLRLSFRVSLSGTDLRKGMEEVAAFEQCTHPAPHRLVDMRGLQDIALDKADIEGFVTARMREDLSTPVRNAILVESPVERAFATMYQSLLSHPTLTISIFDDEIVARAWLAEAGQLRSP